MRILRAAVLAVVAAVVAVPVGASAASAAPAPEQGPTYYLSLGDSLAYGFQGALFADQVASGGYDPAAFVGYTDYLTHRLSRLTHGPVTDVSYGCPGETTASFLTACAFTAGGAPATWLHDPYTTSQLAAAAGFLTAHRGQVAAVTLSLGSNDLRATLTSCLRTPGCDLRTAVPQSVAAIIGRLAVIAKAVESADPGVPLAIANFYNPEVDDPALPAALRASTDTLVASINNQLAAFVATLDRAGLPVVLADAYGAVNGGIPGRDSAQAVCILTSMCTPLHDIHPTTAGYTSLSRAFLTALDR